jgi:transposase InsO family protein
MAKTIKEERLRWVMPIVNKEVKLMEVMKVFPYGKRTLERWVAAYKSYGQSGLEPKSTRPKMNPKQTPIEIKQRVIALRKQTKSCALKLHWKLQKQGLNVHERTIGKILKAEGLVRRYNVRRVKYKYLKAVLKPGDMLEMDVKYVPGHIGGKRYYQYTAIDCASRWRYIEIYDEQSNYCTLEFLKQVQGRFPLPIYAIKTDNHPTFTNRSVGYPKSADPRDPRLHPLDLYCASQGITHYLIDKGKPAQNGTIERSHRSDQETFYNQARFTNSEDLRYKARLWTMEYNDLEHCGLNGKTPNEILKQYQFFIPPYLCA